MSKNSNNKTLRDVASMLKITENELLDISEKYSIQPHIEGVSLQWNLLAIEKLKKGLALENQNVPKEDPSNEDPSNEDPSNEDPSNEDNN